MNCHANIFLVLFSITKDESPDDRTPTVNIPDRNLRVKINSELRKEDDATITVADMEKLLRLRAERSNISDLTGLELATKLRSLFLYGNNISDLSPLSGLTKLTLLNLNENNISDLPVLSRLTTLD